jgi:hypothetical protein
LPGNVLELIIDIFDFFISMDEDDDDENMSEVNRNNNDNNEGDRLLRIIVAAYEV